MRQMLSWFFWRSSSIRQVEMPANILEPVLHLDRPIAVQSASDDPVIADCIIAIQSKPRDVHGDRVSRRCSFDIERTGFAIAAETPSAPFFLPTPVTHSR